MAKKDKKDNKDIIDDIVKDRPGFKTKELKVSDEKQSTLDDLETKKHGKRFLKNNKYFQKYKINGKTRTIKWSSSKKITRKRLIPKIKKIRKKRAKKKVKQKLKQKDRLKPIPKGKYRVEKIQTTAGQVFYLRYRSQQQRSTILEILYENYEFEDFKTIRLQEKYYIAEAFKGDIIL